MLDNQTVQQARWTDLAIGFPIRCNQLVYVWITLIQITKFKVVPLQEIYSLRYPKINGVRESL